MCGYKLAFMDATPSCLTVDLTRTKDFPDFGNDPILNVFFQSTEGLFERDTPVFWEEGPEQGLQIFQVSIVFFYFSVASYSANVFTHSLTHQLTHVYSP